MEKNTNAENDVLAIKVNYDKNVTKVMTSVGKVGFAALSALSAVVAGVSGYFAYKKREESGIAKYVLGLVSGFAAYKTIWFGKGSYKIANSFDEGMDKSCTILVKRSDLEASPPTSEELKDIQILDIKNCPEIKEQDVNKKLVKDWRKEVKEIKNAFTPNTPSR